jgi:enamine deaminase RidA (YjgF/YER057c/UK114 family)
MAEIRRLDPPGLAATGSSWCQCVVHGDTVYVSGQVAWEADGTVVGEGSVTEQTEKVIDNIEAALAAAGSSLAQLVRITTYVTSADAIPEVRAVRERRFANVRPASTLVVVAALADPRLLVEIDAVAALP